MPNKKLRLTAEDNKITEVSIGVKGLNIYFRKRTLVSKKGSPRKSSYLEKHLRDEGTETHNCSKIKKGSTLKNSL